MGHLARIQTKNTGTPELSSHQVHCIDCCRLSKYIVILMASNKFFLSTRFSDEVYRNGTGKWFPSNDVFLSYSLLSRVLLLYQ